MISRFSIISRRKVLSEADFTRHWKTTHADLARVMPGVRSYWQNHIADRLFEMSPSPLQQIDGIAQQQFDDRSALKIAEDSPEYAAVKKDIPEFQGGITILVVSSQTLQDGRTDDRSAKLLWISRLRASQASGWEDGWRQRLGSALEEAHARKAISHIVVDGGRPVGASVPQGESNADTVTEIWFDSTDALNRFVNSAPGTALLKQDAALETICIYRIDVYTVV